MSRIRSWLDSLVRRSIGYFLLLQSSLTLPRAVPRCRRSLPVASHQARIPQVPVVLSGSASTGFHDFAAKE
jgi:hypothetical protein